MVSTVISHDVLHKMHRVIPLRCLCVQRGVNETLKRFRSLRLGRPRHQRCLNVHNVLCRTKLGHPTRKHKAKKRAEQRCFATEHDEELARERNETFPAVK